MNYRMLAALDYRESDRRTPLEPYQWTRYRCLQRRCEGCAACQEKRHGA